MAQAGGSLTSADSDVLFRTVVSTAVDGIVVIDAKGRVLLYNEACARLFGYEADEVIGQNVRMLMPEPFREQHDGYLNRYIATGEARITTGGNLKARYVIHTVGPIYKDGLHGEPDLLASCYRESLKLASAKGLKSLAFPSISTGAYGYPMADAAKVALTTVKDYLTHHPEIEQARFVLFGRSAYEVYEKVLKELS